MKSRNQYVSRAVAFAVAVSGMATASQTHAAVINWNGSVDQNWNTTGNWDGGALPVAANDVSFSLGNQTVNLSSNVAINSLTQTNSGDVTINAGANTLTVSANFGTRVVGSTLELVGTASSSFVRTGGPTFAITNKATFFNGSSYAGYDASGKIRAVNYYAYASRSTTGTASGDARTASYDGSLGPISLATEAAANILHWQFTGNVTNSGNMNGNAITTRFAGAFNLDGGGQELRFNGILKAGGGTSTISNYNFMTGPNNTDLVIRTDLATDTLVIAAGNTNGIIDFSGATSGLTKTGAGTLVLSGANTYTGVTSVTGGKLTVNGALANTAVTVYGTNSTLSGTGSFAGGTTIKSGAILAPGSNSTGTLSNYGGVSTTMTYSNGLTINSGAKLNFDTGDTIKVTGGTLTLGGGLLTLDNGVTLSSAAVYTLFNFTGASLAASPSLSLTNTLSGVTSAFSQSGNNYILTLTASGGTPVPALSITSPASAARALAGTNVAAAGQISTTTANFNSWTLSNNAGQLTVSGFTPATGSTVVGTPTNYTASVATGSTLGSRTYNIKVDNGSQNATASSTLTVVTSRTLTSATTLSLGRVLTGSAISTTSNATGNTYGSGGTGAFGDTETATTTAGGNSANGLAINVTGSTINTNAGFTGAITGNITGTGNLSGSYTLVASRELSGSQTGVTVGWSATAVAARTYTPSNPTVTVSGLLKGASFNSGSINLLASSQADDVATRSHVNTITNAAVGAYTLNSAGVTYNGPATLTGTLTGTTSYTGGSNNYNVAVVSDELVASGNQAVTIAVSTAGLATADKTNSRSSFTGTVLTAPVALNASYAGLASKVNAETAGGGSVNLGTEAILLQGKNSTGSGETVSMTWRTRNTNEVYPSPSGGPFTTTKQGLLSDVVRLTGMSNNGTAQPNGTVQTDPFALQMSYSQAAFAATGWGTSNLAIGWLDNVDTTYNNSNDVWRPATLGNFPGVGLGTNVILGYIGDPDGPGGNAPGSWANFVAQYSVTDANLGTFLGSTGIDTADNVVWAVLNHNSDFAVIPEPASLGLLALGGLALLTRRRRA